MTDVSLWMLIGLPGSGKSTWACRFCQSFPELGYISTDQIRKDLFGDEAIQGPWREVWQRVLNDFDHTVEAAQRGHCIGTVYDATNTQRKGRRRVIRAGQRAGFTRFIAVWIDAPLDHCLSRNRQRSRRVPPEVIETMARQIAGTPPHWEEGFDAVYRLRPLLEKSPRLF